MGPKIKHTYRSSNSRRRLSLYDKDSSKDASLFKSYTSSTVRAQQEQVQQMKSDLQVRERKILQDISNLNNAPTSKPQRQPLHQAINSHVLPDDINERFSFVISDEVPSFVASPMIFKETSFHYNQPADDSFILFDKSKLKEYADYNVDDDEIIPKIPGSSSSPNKVPGSVDIPTSELGSVFDYYEHQDDNLDQRDFKQHDIDINSNDDDNNSCMASPISEKSIGPSEIEPFTIDPNFLNSFEGIWRRTLDHPVQAVNPDSPDHFDRIPMVSRGAASRKGNKYKKSNQNKHLSGGC